jgi:hypothetical protein
MPLQYAEKINAARSGMARAGGSRHRPRRSNLGIAADRCGSSHKNLLGHRQKLERKYAKKVN